MITSASNQKIKKLRALNSKRKERKESGLFTAEGIKILREAPAELIKEVFVSESFETDAAELLAAKGITQYEVIADSLFKSICDTQTPQGVITVFCQPVCTESEFFSRRDPFYLVLEDVQDPGNVGTIIRTAEGAGVQGIILSAGCADVFSPKTIRSTMGSVFRVPLFFTEDAVSAVKKLKELGVQTYAAMPLASAEYDEPDYKGGTAILIGNEGNGLSDEISAEADVALRIPMEGRLESLNAAIASAILMYAVHSKRK